MKNLLVSLFFLNALNYPCIAQQPYQLGVQENVQGGAASSYPLPQMMGAPTTNPGKKPKKTISGKAIQSNNNITQSGNVNQINNNIVPETFSVETSKLALPPAFLGVWQVHGRRTSVEALPEFQASAQNAFTMSNDQLWNISGTQEVGYNLGSNTGISTALIVDKVQGNIAFIRYQHPVGNTMAQEAIVMQLNPSGAQFDGIERISIVKQGLSQPRAKVQYQLSGMRQ